MLILNEFQIFCALVLVAYSIYLGGKIWVNMSPVTEKHGKILVFLTSFTVGAWIKPIWIALSTIF